MSQKDQVKDQSSISLSRRYNASKFDILLVEDNQDHAGLIIHGLEKYDIACSVHHVKDGRAALDYLGSCNGNMPSLILLDLRLPKVDGLEVLKIIKTSDRLRLIPVVILTTSESEIDIVKAYNGYVNSYLVKPVDFELFQKLMRDLGFYWLECNARLY